MDLDGYLQGDYRDDRATVTRLRDVSLRALDMFSRIQNERGWWPYELMNLQQIEDPTTFSFSTTAMIVHALAITTGRIKSSVLVPAVRTWKPVDSTDEVESSILKGVEALVNNCDEGANMLSRSVTWGDDDPLTLAWLNEIVHNSLAEDRLADLQARVVRTARQRIEAAFVSPRDVVLTGASFSGKAVAIPHVFPMLRLVQLYKGLGSDLAVDTSRVESWLTEQLHLQLSFSAIHDSDFDPAQLTFALEGLLLLNRNVCEVAVIERVVEVLHGASSRNSYWRPVRPLTINAQGLVLLPQSVEVANSLLRVCDLLDRADPSSMWFAKSLDLLKNYSAWLESRCVKGRTVVSNGAGQQFEGWQSEHTHADGVVHVWATSQVLLFLQHYGAMLQQHVARTLRDLAGLAVTSPGSPDLDRQAKWKAMASKEPLNVVSTSRHRVYEQVSQYFIAPRLNPGPGIVPHYSMLLLGPPGTGKTSFAEDLAAVLRYDLITITPSDFIQTGEARVEARARAIFQVLREQSNVVVLFDEIDRLILDRDSDEYGLQSDMFQFMTPGMLTKLNELRHDERVVFIVGTNYAERIDSAIKRRGRIDDQLVLLPPGSLQRRHIITSFLESLGQSTNEITEEQWHQMLMSTVLFAYQELRHVCERAIRITAEAATISDGIVSAAGEFTPSIRLTSYRNRFPNEDGNLVKQEVERGPPEEFLLLSYLVAESGKSPVRADWMRDVITEGLRANLLDDPIRATLEAAIA